MSLATGSRKTANSQRRAGGVELQNLESSKCKSRADTQLITDDVIDDLENTIKSDLEGIDDADQMKDIVCKHVRGVLANFECDIREWVSEQFGKKQVDEFDTAKRWDEFDDLVKGIKDHRTDTAESLDRIVKLEASVKKLQSDTASLNAAMEAQEMYSRRNSIRIYGIAEQPVRKDTSGKIIEREDTSVKALAILKDKLGLDLTEKDFDRSHRVGLVKKDAKGPRAIIVKLARHEVKDKVIRARHKLAKSGTVIREDLTAERIRWIKSLKKAGANYKWISTNDGTISVDVDGNREYVRSESDLAKVESVLASSPRVAAAAAAGNASGSG